MIQMPRLVIVLATHGRENRDGCLRLQVEWNYQIRLLDKCSL
jgi:hypothetical protein